MQALKKAFKKADDPKRYQPVPREQYLSLGLATPPLNGWDEFLSLKWCRDTKEEKRQQKEAEKKKKTDVPIVKTYVLCLCEDYGNYRESDPPINLNKRGYKPLPLWKDDDFMYEILRNGSFFQNDDFIMEKYPQAIRPAEDYPYAEQYVKAYQHHNGGATPTYEQIEEHKITVVATIMERLERYEAEATDRDTETIQKLKDIIVSMVDRDAELEKKCKERVDELKAGGDTGKKE